MPPYLTLVFSLLILQCLHFSSSKSQAEETLQITSDEPVLMGSNVTFVLSLKNWKQDSYDVNWVELTGRYRNQVDHLDKKNGFTCNWTLNYEAENGTDKYIFPGNYAVTATVTYQIFFFTKNVGTVVSNFLLSPNFVGKLEARQEGIVPFKKASNLISTANETTLAVNLHDPYDYLKQGTNVTWTWYNSTGFMANTTSPSLKHNITKEGDYSFNVTLTALFPSKTHPNTTMTRGGVFEGIVTARDPIANFSVHGETWFPHGRLLNLRILCNGSQPFTYCIQMHEGVYNLTGNETCGYPEGTTDCDIPYGWYFGKPGYHTLIIIIQNDIGRIVNRTLVNAYNVSKKQPLSIVIVPLTCSLLALVMIIFGVAYFWENRGRYSVEVADFDFGQHDELPYMTFVERLKDALSTSTSSRQRLYNSTDDDPILGHRRPSQFS